MIHFGINFEPLLLSWLLNSLWQLPLIFAAAWAAARLLRHLGPLAEHCVWVVCLFLQVLLPAGSLRFGIPGIHLWRAAAASSHATVTSSILAQEPSRSGVILLPPVLLSALTFAYLSTILYFAGRFLWKLSRTAKLLRYSELLHPSGILEPIWSRSSHRLNVPDAHLGISSFVSGPVTVGIRHPALLLPPGFLQAVAPSDLEAVLAHEFAHMRRHDFASNIAFELLSLPLAFHPFLHLTRSRIAETREMVCDAVAAAATSGKENYARTLLRLASMLVQPTRASTLHTVGIFDANVFERRVMKLTQAARQIRPVRRFASLAVCTFLALATCVSAVALRLNVESRGPSGAQAESRQAGFTPPEVVHRVPPIYPPKARAEKNTIDGPVDLALKVKADGTPADVHITKSLRADYDQSAIEAVRQWRFKPAQRDGVSVAASTHIEIGFSIQ